MLTRDFDYDLPEELIAQHPVEPRDSSRLLVLDRRDGHREHRRFRDLIEYLVPGDLLVVNETRVIPARLYAHKIPSGGQVELLLLAKRDPTRWEALVKGRRAWVGQKIVLGALETPRVVGTVEEITEAGGRLIQFEEPIEGYLDEIGHVPLPPYIHEPLEDDERYQTIYAREEGSVAAPTAGLHFTPELIARIEEMGVEWASVVLNIGLDTFRPVGTERVEDHQIHTEYCRLDAETAERINAARSEGRRVIAVGTTSVRVLETAGQRGDGRVAPWDGPTRIFIYPGYRFKVVDALVTNFHLPRSSLIMLVSAFAGREQIAAAYQEAVCQRYRFFSFGDSMLII